MALTLNLVAVPVLAALVAGTGAVSAFVSAGSPAATAGQTDQTCAAQTWPYIDGKCMTSSPARAPVRMVMAPRSNEDERAGLGSVSPATLPAVTAPTAPAAAPQGAPTLTSRDTVLRQPDASAPPPKVGKSREKRSDQRRERRLVTQAYQVPGEFDRRSRAVLVVRPLRLEAFR